MKNISKLAVLIFFVTFFGCSEDFLNQKAPDKLTTDNFYRNKADAEAALASAYAQIKASNRWDVTEVNCVVEHFRSDFCQPGPDAWNYPDWSSLSTFTYTSGNSRFSMYWTDTYRGINHANQVIDGVGAMPSSKISDDAKKQIVAEAKFLRAFLYFRLINNWGRVPLLLHFPKTESDIHVPLSESAAIWDQIEKDLNEALADLPNSYSDSDKGRATKGAAYGYLGKAHLYQKEWGDAITAFEHIIGRYSLQSEFLSNFDGSAENNSESVFEIQYTPNKVSGRNIDHVYAYMVAPGEMGGWGDIEATQTLLNEMKSEGKIATTGKYDTRLYKTLYFNDPDVDIYGSSYANLFGATETKVIFRKYLPTADYYPFDNNTAWYWSQNIPQMRYADVLLMYAEALNENNRTAEAYAPVNQVRSRADMPPLSSGLSQSDMRSKIIHERSMELAFEGCRFFDLRRWGMLESAMQNSGKDGASNFNLSNHAYFPIPDEERNTNTALNN